MDQLAMLWQYQVEDRKADKLEQELSRSPLRQKMNTCRTQFNAKQKQYKQMEEQVAILSDRKDAIRDAITRCEEQLRHLQSRFEQNPPTELDDTKALLSEVNRFLETIGSYEQEMKRMAKDANDYDQKERSLRRDAIKLKEEFDNLKKQYDKESPEKEAALKAQKAIVAKKGEGISPELLARYSQINRTYWRRLERGELTKPQVLLGRFEEFFAEEGIDVSLAPQFNDAYQLRLGDTIVYRDDSYEIVKSLRGKVRQCVVSNGTVVAQPKKLTRSGLAALMDGVFLSEQLGAEKPKKKFFDQVFAAIGPVEKGETMIVGDSLTSDIRGGDNAGIVTCWYNPEGIKAPEGYRIDHEIRDLHEVYGLL